MTTCTILYDLHQIVLHIHKGMPLLPGFFPRRAERRSALSVIFALPHGTQTSYRPRIERSCLDCSYQFCFPCGGTGQTLPLRESRKDSLGLILKCRVMSEKIKHYTSALCMDPRHKRAW